MPMKIGIKLGCALGSVYEFSKVFDLVKMIFEAKRGLRGIFILKNASFSTFLKAFPRPHLEALF
jgi:hypothetical protein